MMELVVLKGRGINKFDSFIQIYEIARTTNDDIAIFISMLIPQSV